MDADLGIMQFYQKRSISFIFVKTLDLSTQIERVFELSLHWQHPLLCSMEDSATKHESSWRGKAMCKESH